MAGSRVELFAGIRRDARVEGLSIRQLAERHAVHRRTVRQALASAVPPPRKTPVRTSPWLDPFKVAVVEPMLVASGSQLPEGESWWAELKLDGARGQLRTAGGTATLRTRRGRRCDGEFPEIIAAAQWLPDVILDGEIVVIGDHGGPTSGPCVRGWEPIPIAQAAWLPHGQRCSTHSTSFGMTAKISADARCPSAAGSLRRCP
jgi:ATP-dependent DNA ligase